MKPGLLLALALVSLVGCGPGPLDVVDLASTTLTSGLVAHWTFDETDGSIVHDRSGNKRDGMVSGATWVEDGQFAGALHFKQGDTVTVDPFPDATGSWSVSMWLRVAPAELLGGTVTAISAEVVFQGGWEINIDEAPSDLHLHFGYWTGPLDTEYSHFDTSAWQSARWSHVTAVVNAQTARTALYVDGSVRSEGPIIRTISPGSATLYFGTWSGPDKRLFAGSIDDVAIYSRALTTREVVELQQHPAPPLH
jgi:Concanavalin A-like lectin/glucanases superfamily